MAPNNQKATCGQNTVNVVLLRLSIMLHTTLIERLHDDSMREVALLVRFTSRNDIICEK